MGVCETSFLYNNRCRISLGVWGIFYLFKFLFCLLYTDFTISVLLHLNILGKYI